MWNQPPPTKPEKRPPKPKQVNPIEAAIRSWFESLPEELLDSISTSHEVLISSAPRRWTVYPPMIFLPSGSFGPEWEARILHLTPEQKDELWKLILRKVGKREGKGVLTHLAINSGIPLIKSGNEDHRETENILRTPSGLIMLYGDFGPALSPNVSPTAQDFEHAFWVSTKQNGITQIWAPRYTMFSRGNIKEKSRLLDFHKNDKFDFKGVSTEELGKAMAVDLYAGIGYFVFSYVMMGLERVVGWELNPWSVEGLRRGAIANGWSVQIVKTGEEVRLGDEKIIIFQEDNNMVEERCCSQTGKYLLAMKTLHVNCGLLPTSLPVWKSALTLLEGEGWLHLHENVGVSDIPKRSLEIAELFRHWEILNSKGRTVKVEHVERIKTFAPGVWHCVFDLRLGDRSQANASST